MPVRETSLIAYTNKVLPQLGYKQSQVYRLFLRWRDCNFTNAEVARELGWPINTVTPRTGELRDLGVIVELPRRVCRVTGNKAIPKRLK